MKSVVNLSFSRWPGIAAVGAVCTLSILLGLKPVQAAGIPIFGTGVDASGSVLPGGSIDPHWQIVAGPGITSAVSAVVVSNQHPYGNYFEYSNSRWIWLSAGGGGSTGTPYTFRLQFDLTGYDPNTTTISAAWGADDWGSVLLNGSTPTGSGQFFLPRRSDDANYNVPSKFTIDGGFLPGINHLDFQIVDTGNPGGLNVTNLVGVTPVVPEPSTTVLFFAGLTACCLRLHRRAGQSCESATS